MKTRKKNNSSNVRKVFAKLTVKNLIQIKGGDEGIATPRDKIIE